VFTGLRRGELLALTPEHVRNGTILLRANETKGKKARAVPVHPAIEEILRERLPIGIRSAALNAHWDQARTACGLKHVRWHDLRHSFASWLAANPSVPLTEIRDLLGHSSLAITNKYAHLRVNSASVRALPTIVPQSILVEKATDEYPVINQSLGMEARVGIEPAYTELQGNEEIVEVLDFMG
jgi:integrase